MFPLGYIQYISITGTDSNLIQISISSQMEINGSENIANECVVVVTNWEIIFAIFVYLIRSPQFLYVLIFIYLYLRTCTVASQNLITTVQNTDSFN